MIGEAARVDHGGYLPSLINCPRNAPLEITEIIREVSAIGNPVNSVRA